MDPPFDVTETSYQRGARDIPPSPDSYAAQCVPNMVPDFSDQLTEAEVAEPGFNGGDSHTGGGGSGHH
ncbi:MAG TPA: hypothetical protein VH185_01600 [Mycobacterium sp.]|jgi:hypothetical protein|nr:hypothetical protein [Mycobacterium sp.]